MSTVRLTSQRMYSHVRRSLHVLKTVPEVRAFRKQTLLQGKTIGFVPTMGALHDGHIQLMQQAKKENDLSMASIFVNPTQFSAGEDLDKYPRTLESDLNKLTAAGIDAVFVPNGPEMYHQWPSTKQLCHVEPSDFSHIFEGKARPEFFRGVATVVCKLFNIVTPDTAYFGQKDISQCILINNLVLDLNMDVETRIVATIRDGTDGLALSSRNAYLLPHERSVAGVLYRALRAGQQLIESASSSDKLSREAVMSAIQQELDKEPLVTRTEYISIASHIDMKELETGSIHRDRGAVISSAIRLGNVRLIDNVLVGKANDILYK